MTSSPDSALPASPPGELFAGKYVIERVIAQGGMGIVYAARHLKLDQSVALKVLLPGLHDGGEVTARFAREGRAAARLKSPHVARILDVDTTAEGTPFLVMELLQGRDLGDLLRATGPLPVGVAVRYVLEACDAIAEAHSLGIVHRDLKPTNLFLADVDGRPTVKVVDFGISKVTSDVGTDLTTSAAAFGTPLYMSPEQVRSAKSVDGRADIWSLGVVLYELLTGTTPFDVGNATGVLAAIIADEPPRVSEHRPDVPKGLADAIAKTLRKKPTDRYQDVAAFARAIEPFAAGDWSEPSSRGQRIVIAIPNPRASSNGALASTSPRLRSRASLAVGLLAGGALTTALLWLTIARFTSSSPTVVVSALPSTTAPVTTQAAAVVSPMPSATPSVASSGAATAPIAAGKSTASPRAGRPGSSSDATSRPAVTAPPAPPPAPPPKPTIDPVHL